MERADDAIKKNIRKAFFVGGNSSCRTHIRQHYTIYKERCQRLNIPENHHAIPRSIWKEMQELKQAKTKTQASLDGMIERAQGPREFTREAVLHAVCQFIACNDQVSVATCPCQERGC
jgi:hypothetical protein